MGGVLVLVSGPSRPLKFVPERLACPRKFVPKRRAGPPMPATVMAQPIVGMAHKPYTDPYREEGRGIGLFRLGLIRLQKPA